MKIPLNMDNSGAEPARDAQNKALDRDFKAARRGDWQARHNLIRAFTPLINSLAEKRAGSDQRRFAQYAEAGKAGVEAAVKKHKPSIASDSVQIFALDHIEKAMDRVDSKGGFLQKLFNRR